MPESLEKGAAVRFPPPLVPLFILLAGAGLGFAWPLGLGVSLPKPERYWAGGLVIVSAIAVLGLWPVLLFRRTGQSVIPWTATPQILMRGPYRFTRNPMYLQMLLVCVGFAIVFANGWILALTPLCAVLLHYFAIEPEEAYLEKTFGESYLAYKKKVRRWL